MRKKIYGDEDLGLMEFHGDIGNASEEENDINLDFDSLLEDDEISDEEEGFFRGYYEEEEESSEKELEQVLDKEAEDEK